MRRIDFSFISLTVIMFLIAGCVPPGPRSDWPVQDLYSYGLERFEKKDYFRATEAFQIITLSYSGSDLVDDALFYLGESHRLAGEYPVAVVTYRRLIRDFPQSQYSDDAQYQLAVSIFNQSSPVSLTQDKTYEAIRELQIFIDEFPDSEVTTEAMKLLRQCYDKLAEKDYNIGHLYFRLRDWAAARLYFEELIQAFPTSNWSRLAQYEIAESYAREQKWDKALEAFNIFVQRYPDHELVPEAQNRMAEVEEALEETNRKNAGQSDDMKPGRDKNTMRQAGTRPVQP